MLLKGFGAKNIHISIVIKYMHLTDTIIILPKKAVDFQFFGNTEQWVEMIRPQYKKCVETSACPLAIWSSRVKLL